MQLRAQLLLFSFVIDVGMKDCSNSWKMIIFKYFQPFCSVSSEFWVGPGADYDVFRENCLGISWNDKDVTCSCVPNYIYIALWSKSEGRSAQNYEKWSIGSIFGRCGLFLHYFGQFQAWIILYVMKVIGIVAWRIVFILLLSTSARRVHKLTLNGYFSIFWLREYFSAGFWEGQGVDCIRNVWADNCYSIIS